MILTTGDFAAEMWAAPKLQENMSPSNRCSSLLQYNTGSHPVTGLGIYWTYKMLKWSAVFWCRSLNTLVHHIAAKWAILQSPGPTAAEIITAPLWAPVTCWGGLYHPVSGGRNQQDLVWLFGLCQVFGLLRYRGVTTLIAEDISFTWYSSYPWYLGTGGTYHPWYCTWYSRYGP